MVHGGNSSVSKCDKETTLSIFRQQPNCGLLTSYAYNSKSLISLELACSWLFVNNIHELLEIRLSLSKLNADTFNFENTVTHNYCMIVYDFTGTDSALNGIAHFLETPRVCYQIYHTEAMMTLHVYDVHCIYTIHQSAI